MTVGELREWLKNLPADTLVLCSNDDEVNGLHECNPFTSNVDAQAYGYETCEDGDIEAVIL